jgi:tetratricopeptide (TPR) repeat protein
MADRYIYIPSIGFFLLMSIFIYNVSKKQPVLILLFFICLVFYGYTTINRVKVWNNNYTVWDDVIKKNSHVPIAFNNRGIVKRDSGNIVGAYNDFKEATNLDPKFKEALNNLGISSFQLGKGEEALTCFTKAIQLDSTFADGYYNRGKLQKINNELHDALLDLNSSINLNKLNGHAYLLRAKVKIMLNDYTGAINDCDFVLSLNQSIDYAAIVKAVALCKLENYSNAASILNNYIQNNASSASAFYVRGFLNFKIGAKKAYEDDLQKAKNLGFDPEKSEITKDFGLIK